MHSLNKLLFTFLCVLGSFSINIAHSHESTCKCPKAEFSQKLGRILVQRFWKDVENQNVRAYSDQFDDTFQGLNLEGIYNKASQIEALKNLTVTSFKLKKLISVRHENTLVISYDFYAQGEGIVSGPCIDIWVKKGKEWKQVSHSYVPFLEE